MVDAMLFDNLTMVFVLFIGCVSVGGGVSKYMQDARLEAQVKKSD